MTSYSTYAEARAAGGWIPTDTARCIQLSIPPSGSVADARIALAQGYGPIGRPLTSTERSALGKLGVIATHFLEYILVRTFSGGSGRQYYSVWAK